jgi:hypothetical protein
VFVHVVFVQLLEKGFDNILVCGLRWELDGLLVGCIDDAEVLMVRDVKEVDVLLCLLVASLGIYDLEAQFCTYTAEFPFVFFRHPSRLSGR